MAKRESTKTESTSTKPVWVLQVVSSTISEVRYDVKRKILFVQFKSGDVYGYPDFRMKEFKEFTLAESQGKFFAEHIKEREFYEVEKKPKRPKFMRLVESGNIKHVCPYMTLKDAVKEKLGPKQKGCIYKGDMIGDESKLLMIWGKNNWVFFSDEHRKKYADKIK